MRLAEVGQDWVVAPHDPLVVGSNPARPIGPLPPRSLPSAGQRGILSNMVEEAPGHRNASPGAVFLSYASQDAGAALRICQALRGAGIEVFLDQSELRGGDVWDRKIRHEIQSCALFMPVISVNTASRHEGYFRLEWDLADQRSHMMARSRVFVVPVCLDATTEAAADVPDSFKRVQWTRLPGGETPPAFVERVRRLLSPDPLTASSPLRGASGAVPSPSPARPIWRSRAAMLAMVFLLILAALGYLGTLGSRSPEHALSATAVRARTGTFSPPPHSVAVLPFLNMSGDKEQEYFSEGLTEEVLNSLAAINQLQVAARTSAFSFKGTNTDIGTIARKLNVGAVLEGSVRRSGNTVRITTQLINAVTGFHLWTHTYDRNLSDVFKVQTDIANAVATALKVSLLGDMAAKVEVGGTRDPAAFDAYLRGRRVYTASLGAKDDPTAIGLFSEAIRLDPGFALAFAYRSITLSTYAGETSGTTQRESYDKAQSDALRAIELAPDLNEAHIALAQYFEGVLDFTRASGEYGRALELAPGNAQVLRLYGMFAAQMGHFEAAIAAVRRGAVLDSLNPHSHRDLGIVLRYARRYSEALVAYEDALALDPADRSSQVWRGLTYYGLAEFDKARSSCEVAPDYWVGQWCLAIVYNRLGRGAEAESTLAKLQAALGDGSSYQYASIYAQWGKTSRALEWLETAYRLRDPTLEYLKTDPLMDPLRREPRFQAVLSALKFPD